MRDYLHAAGVCKGNEDIVTCLESKSIIRSMDYGVSLKWAYY